MLTHQQLNQFQTPTSSECSPHPHDRSDAATDSDRIRERGCAEEPVSSVQETRREKRREETRTARQRRVCGETRDRDAAAKEQLDALDEEAVHEAHDVRERQPLELPAEPLAARGGREVARRLLARAERLIRRRLNIR